MAVPITYVNAANVAVTAGSTNPLPVQFTGTSAPAAADILVRRATTSATTTATSLLTVPAGRTWTGTVGASVSAANNATSIVAGRASVILSTSGTGVVPSVGDYFGLVTVVGAGTAAATSGSQSANSSSMPLVVIAPAGNSVSIDYATINTGSTAIVEIFATGRLT